MGGAAIEQLQILKAFRKKLLTDGQLLQGLKASVAAALAIALLRHRLAKKLQLLPEFRLMALQLLKRIGKGSQPARIHQRLAGQPKQAVQVFRGQAKNSLYGIRLTGSRWPAAMRA